MKNFSSRKRTSRHVEDDNSRRARRERGRRARYLSRPRRGRLAAGGPTTFGPRSRSAAVGKDVVAHHPEHARRRRRSGHHVDETRRPGRHRRRRVRSSVECHLFDPTGIGGRPRRRAPPPVVAAAGVHLVAHRPGHGPVARARRVGGAPVAAPAGAPTGPSGPRHCSPRCCTPRRSRVPTCAPSWAGWTAARRSRPNRSCPAPDDRPSPGTSSTGSSPPTSASSAASGRRPRAPSAGFRSEEALAATCDPDFDPLGLRLVGRHRLHRRPGPPPGAGRPPGRRVPRRRPARHLRTGGRPARRSDPPVRPGPRRTGQHRPAPRPAGDDQRGRRPGSGHPGLLPGPVPGPAPLARPRPTGSRRCSEPRWSFPGSATCGRWRRCRSCPATTSW